MSDERTPAGQDRLDSWKEIADYLGRDVRTVRRWEKTTGLPVRRVGGDRGRSAFAFRSEIDAWLRRADVAAASSPLPADPEPGPVPVPLLATDGSRRSHPLRWTAIASIALVLVLIAWRFPALLSGKAVTTVQMTSTAIVAAGANGRERWRHALPANERIAHPNGRLDLPAEVLRGHSGVLAATAYGIRNGDDAIRSGTLFWLAADGALLKTFTFEDRTQFESGTYTSPWSITDYRVDGNPDARRIAVAAHHYQWWPSLVTILDGAWNRRGTFVNAGWIERVHWLSPDRLVVAGFFNPLDGGMVALLDANAIDGQSPPAPGGEGFRCTACGPATPIRYVVLPRSEVNRAGPFPFNRAILQVTGDRLVLRTVEMPSTGADAADALYEFSPSLTLLRAGYSDRYWDAHRALEARGQIDHPRERCPDRNGPRAFRVWEPQSGWTTVAVQAGGGAD